MKQGSKRELTPQLRFPEFRDEPGWSEKELHHYLTESRVPGSNGSIAKKLTVKLWGKGVFEKSDSIKGSENTQYYQRRAGQFIYSKLDFLHQAFGIIPDHLDGFESTVDLPCFDISASLNPYFLLEYVSRESFYKNYGEIADGGRKAKRIQADSFLAFPIAMPRTLSEQRKIADCLSSLDEVIAAQARKVDTLKAHKKGLMQQLFPRKGENLPRLRLPEFQGGAAWEVKPLRQVATYENGKAYEQDVLDHGKYVVVNARFISTNGAVRKYSDAEYCIAEAGDVLMVLSDLPKGRALAKCYFVERDHLYAVNQRVCRISPSKASGRFLYYALNRHPFLLAFDDGMNQTHLRKEAVLDCPVSLPPEEEEQHQIAESLSFLDRVLDVETQKLSTLKTHKKGLMQQLFPSSGEREA